jgi:hypothetical protein
MNANISGRNSAEIEKMTVVPEDNTTGFKTHDISLW